MATVFESIPLAGLRKAHLEQLLWYVEQQEHVGTYYGNYNQFINRQDDLINLLTWAIEYANSEGVILPKIKK